MYKKLSLLLLLLLLLSSCQVLEPVLAPILDHSPAEPTLVMETQYYDRYSNYVEIPALALPAGEENQVIDAINAALNDLRDQYAFAQDSIRGGNLCLLYPSTTDRYLNLVFYMGQSDYGNDGDIRSLTYDKQEAVLVTTEDALSLAGTTEEALCDGLEALIAANPDDPRGMYQPAQVLGFRIKADGQPVFYLSAYVDCVDMGENGFLDEWYRLYVWEDGAYTRYSCMVFWDNGQYPLVPAEETDKLDPPLWNQWYFAGEEPAGGFSAAPASSQAAADLRNVLLGNAFFTDAESGLVLDVSRVTEAVTSDTSFTAYPARFAYLDLDQDGTDEAVLWLETEEGDPALAFIVLRWQGEGRVYGYTQFPRLFGDLKYDGTFEFSSSGVDFGVGRVIFNPAGEGDPDQWSTWESALQERINGDWDNLAWYIDGQTVTLDQFQEALNQQQAKENAPWHDFDPETIEQVIS